MANVKWLETALSKKKQHDTDHKRDQLRKVVADLIVSSPHSYNGAVWAAQPQDWYCAELGYSDSTLRRIISKPPFVRACIQIDGRKVTLLREGEDGPMSAKHVANIMAKIWREDMEKRGVATTSVTRLQYGCLFGLAETWPDGHQVEIFKLIMKRWSHFMEGAKIEMAILEVEGKGQTRYYDYPSIPVMRRFSSVALELYSMEKQSMAA